MLAEERKVDSLKLQVFFAALRGLGGSAVGSLIKGRP